MSVQINQLVKSLLKKETLEQCSLQELEQFAERHPYFGAAQLLLTKKLQTEQSDRYDEQLQKTFLFFNNPLWVQHLLNETGNAEIILAEKKEEPVVLTAIPEIQAPEQVRETDDNILPEISSPSMIPAENQEEAPRQPTEDFQANPLSEPISPELNEAHDPVESINDAVIPPTEEATLAEKPKHDFLFEPYHTVDYFASQGIRYKEEPKPADKFSQQLRSFTDWLKTMKRLPVSEVGKNINTDLEKKVEQLAEHSLDAKEVMTEAMAEVWVKQGNTEKATEIYRKLSLLDPSKSVYFAAKIDGLKKKN